ncbi:MBL fold metallo-hydrolase [Proteiniborus sp. MB09-C3]|uniref:MBL fold metallo-hydrolase n=1 Tax=Proteiniborus sp. MB09-C3 TaxID=3050072 RepID=UPI002557828D|nr:MBL fold metallo-hydrolase [Proteiniborus sp. MB09-C3]WIV13381.1 MBL fold metallo-hydrolase [Proteiniborus sp. MB09-C3]
MELIKLKGNTYYIPSNTNIGVFTYKNKNCLLVDAGINNTIARKIEEVLKFNGLHPKYIINTHNHLDHCGGNIYLTEAYPGCITYTSEKEKLYMENTELQPTNLFGALPPKGVNKAKSIKVNDILQYGINKINDEKIEIVSLKGHSIEQIGVITPDKVCFLGDSIFSTYILGKYSIPYLYSIEDSLNTLGYIKEISADIFVVAHSESIYSKEEIVNLADENIAAINELLEECKTILEQPQTREDLLQNIMILNEIPDPEYVQYLLYLSSISAFIAYLYERGYIENYIENGKLYYFVK